jgi:hypothetical protein
VHVEQVNQAKKALASNNRLDDAGAQHWLNMDGWTLEEVLYLLHGEDPRYQGGSMKIGKRRVLLTPSPPDDNLSAFVSRAFQAGALVSPAAPKKVIAWAIGKGLGLPALLIPSNMARKNNEGEILGYAIDSKTALTGLQATTDLPIFNMPVRPVDTPQWLSDLHPDAGVYYINYVEDRGMEGPVEARAVIETIEEVIKRQREGFFTVKEAAQDLDDQYQDIQAAKMVDQLLSATLNGKSIIRGSDKLYLLENERSREKKNLIMASDVDKWFEAQGLNYRLSITAQPLSVIESGNSQGHALPIQRTVVQKKAIIETQSQRRARRYQLCIDAGLTMPPNDYSSMPRGIGAVAKKEGITRQAFVEDMKAHINTLSAR